MIENVAIESLVPKNCDNQKLNDQKINNKKCGD
jgi:hypothetical protein